MPIFINLHRAASGPYLGDGETYETLEAALNNASNFDDYICTHELADTGEYIQKHADHDAIAAIKCEREDSGNLISRCICGQHDEVNHALDPEWSGVGMWG